MVPQWSPVTWTGKSSDDAAVCSSGNSPQWSPVTLTGKSGGVVRGAAGGLAAAMEPGHVDREESTGRPPGYPCVAAAMEPGHVDREEDFYSWDLERALVEPQWSPVTWTGKSPASPARRHSRHWGRMEPGHGTGKRLALWFR